jgi:NADH dehydrogenase/NADH:ubiquinone oxidoreductase subunit G
MKAHPFLVPLLAAITALAPLGAAEKLKLPEVSDYPFWITKKRGPTVQFVPGLNAALQLTDAQKEQIAAARSEMANDEAVKAARGISKSDPSVTTEQREKAHAAIEAATARLREKVSAILTPGQKALIEKINAAHAAAVEDTGIIYADKFASVKADEAARRRIQEEKNQDIEETFLHKLDALLSPAQMEAMKRAAADEEQRSAKAATTKKPVK